MGACTDAFDAEALADFPQRAADQIDSTLAILIAPVDVLLPMHESGLLYGLAHRPLCSINALLRLLDGHGFLAGDG